MTPFYKCVAALDCDAETLLDIEDDYVPRDRRRRHYHVRQDDVPRGELLIFTQIPSQKRGPN